MTGLARRHRVGSLSRQSGWLAGVISFLRIDGAINWRERPISQATLSTFAPGGRGSWSQLTAALDRPRFVWRDSDEHRPPTDMGLAAHRRKLCDHAEQSELDPGAGYQYHDR